MDEGEYEACVTLQEGTRACFQPFAVTWPAVGQAAVTLVEDQVMVIGGTPHCYGASSEVDQVSVYILGDDLLGARAVYLDGLVYVSEGSGTSGLSAYDIADDTWTSLSPMDEARDYHAMVAHDGLIYAREAALPRRTPEPPCPSSLPHAPTVLRWSGRTGPGWSPAATTAAAWPRSMCSIRRAGSGRATERVAQGDRLGASSLAHPARISWPASPGKHMTSPASDSRAQESTSRSCTA